VVSGVVGVIDLSTPSSFEAQLDEALANVHQILRQAVPGQFSGDAARAMVGRFADLERTAASGMALFTPIVKTTGSFAKEGYASLADWLGSLSGTSSGVAKGRLASAERAATSAALTEALHAGELSAAQLTLVTKTSAEVKNAAETLLPLARGGATNQELGDAASRLFAAARQRETERARRARVKAHRHFRWRQVEGGGIRGEFSCDEVDWARVFPILEAAAKERWKAAGAKEGEPLEAHRLDAFIELMAGSAGPDSGPARRAKVETLILIDAEALRRGTTEGDELCEIDGVGPISVAAATELLTEGGLRYLVKEGFDITTVTKSTRDIARCIDAALIARDRVCCANPCGKRHGLERDHIYDFADGGPTELDNLIRLCPEHHVLKTYGGWTIEGRPGDWKWVAPARPKSAGAISRARKLATAKAKAKVNSPRRT
jgi:hypothetical protein